MVIIGNGIMNWEVTIVVLGVQFGLNVLNNICFTFDADDVLDGLTFVVLLASGSEEVV